MGFFDPIWMTKNYNKIDKARAAIRKINDNQKLTEIAMKAPLQLVALEAIQMMNDEETLFEFAKTDGLSNEKYPLAIRTLARERIEDQTLLEKLISSIDYEDVDANMLYEKVENPPLDWNMNMSGEDAEQKLAASVEKLSYPQDEGKLKDVINHAKTQKGIDMAIERLPYEENKEYYKQILLGKDLEKKEHIAKTYPQAQEVLFEIGMDESNDIQIRKQAGMTLGSNPKAQEIWISIAMYFPDIYTRMDAAAMITDVSLIPDIQKQRCEENDHIWVDTGSRGQQYQFGPSSDHRKCIYCGKEHHEYFDGD